MSVYFFKFSDIIALTKCYYVGVTYDTSVDPPEYRWTKDNSAMGIYNNTERPDPYFLPFVLLEPTFNPLEVCAIMYQPGGYDYGLADVECTGPNSPIDCAPLCEGEVP